jgi:hypothetical protein
MLIPVVLHSSVHVPHHLSQIELWNKMLVAGSSSSGSSGDGATSPTGPVGLTREAFLTRWRAFTIEDPRAAFEQVGGWESWLERFWSGPLLCAGKGLSAEGLLISKRAGGADAGGVLTRWRAFTIEDPRAAFEQVGGWDSWWRRFCQGPFCVTEKGCKQGLLI